MKANLIINGKKIEVEITDGLEIKISEEQFKALEAKQAKPTKKTGYERAEKGEVYYSAYSNDIIADAEEYGKSIDNERYDSANYYNDYIVAKNNARADKLLRRLRRFAVEHREKAIDWNCMIDGKYCIYYNYYMNNITTADLCPNRDLGAIYFDSKETAELALENFKDELKWYFTEYKDSL